jgi:hypothetical protein
MAVASSQKQLMEYESSVTIFFASSIAISAVLSVNPSTPSYLVVAIMCEC